jgi:hypothetical protein
VAAAARTRRTRAVGRHGARTSLRSPTPGPAQCAVRAADGRWLVLHASHVDGPAAH